MISSDVWTFEGSVASEAEFAFRNSEHIYLRFAKAPRLLFGDYIPKSHSD